MTTIRFAAYDRSAIYAIGDTPEQAIETARRDAMEPEAEFQTKPITARLEKRIDEIGGNLAFDDTGDALDIHPDDLDG